MRSAEVSRTPFKIKHDMLPQNALGQWLRDEFKLECRIKPAYSKMFYFLDITICGFPSLILDFKIIDTLGRNNLDEFATIHNIRRHNAVGYYLDYLRISDTLAQELATNGENIEQFIYTFGGNIKE